MDMDEQVYSQISRRMGPDFFHKKPPLIFEYESGRLERRAKNERHFNKLRALYEQVPAVICGECGDVCCRESPDIYLLEYLHIRRYIQKELKNPDLEAEIVRHALEWVFLRYVKPETFCPFLIDKKCVIYQVRPINCRLWALENGEYYSKKAERAKEHIKKQNEYFLSHGITSSIVPQKYILPKCDQIRITGDRNYSEEEITGLDLEAAFLHLTLIPHETFKSANFHLHFPGHLAMKKISPAAFDNLCITIAKEYNRESKSVTLDELTATFCGEIP